MSAEKEEDVWMLGCMARAITIIDSVSDADVAAYQKRARERGFNRSDVKGIDRAWVAKSHLRTQCRKLWEGLQGTEALANLNENKRSEILALINAGISEGQKLK